MSIEPILNGFVDRARLMKCRVELERVEDKWKDMYGVHTTI